MDTKEVVEKKEETQKKWKTKFKKNQQVFLTAFLKEEKGVFYVCKGIVQETPGPNERQVYKIKIIAVADRAVTGGEKEVRQARLLGLMCTKKPKELNESLPDFMMPENWIDKAPKDHRYHKPRNKRKKS